MKDGLYSVKLKGLDGVDLPPQRRPCSSEWDDDGGRPVLILHRLVLGQERHLQGRACA